jgi:hypothetical protein
MDINVLHSCFAATLDADNNIRNQAELQLKEAEKVPGFINGCLDIVLEPQVSENVKNAAAVYVKNKVKFGWKPLEDSPNSVDNDEKPVFRERLVPALIKSSPQIRLFLTQAINVIVASDYPNQWPELLDVSLRLVNSGDVHSVHAGLTCLLAITRYYRWTSGHARQGLNHVIQTAFPGVLNVGNTLIDEDDSLAGEMLREVLKIYKMATYHELPVALQQSNSVVAWGSLFLRVIKKQLPQEVLSKDEDEREEHPWVKCKKWAFANLCRLLSRYGVITELSEKAVKYKEFSKMFLHSFVPEIIKAYFEQIQLWVEKRIWLGKACLFHILGFLEECIQVKSTWLLLKPHIEVIVAHVVFPLLCPTDNDLQLFEDDPEEYIHKRIDVYEESTPDIAATNFLLTLLRKRKKSSFNSTLQFIQGIVNQHLHNQMDLELCRKKEGALRMMGAISYVVLAKGSPIVDHMEDFLVQFVFPDFGNPQGFIRARACEFLNRYSEIQFKNPQNVSFAYQSIINCMNDEHLPVQVEASLALQPMIRHEGVREALSARIPEVMQHLLDLANKIDIDALSGVMEEFVEVFSEQLTPFSVQLAQQMRDQFVRLAGELLEKRNVSADDYKEQDDDTSGEDKEMAALGILNTLTSLLLALDNANDIVLKLEDVLMPIYGLVLGQEMEEFYGEVLTLAENSTFCLKAISPNMWEVFKLIHKAVEGLRYLYLEEAMPCLANYIQYGAEGLIANPDYMEILYRIFHNVMTESELGASDRALVCTIAIRLLMGVRGHADRYVSPILDLTISHLRGDGDKLNNTHYRIGLLEVVIASLYYNPQVTLAVLESKGYTRDFFTIWFENKGKLSRVQDKKLSVLAVLGVLLLPDEQIPTSIRDNLAQLAKALVNIMETLPAAVEQRELLTKEYEAEEGYDDYFSGGEDEWDDDDDQKDDDDEDTSAEGQPANEYLEYLAGESADKLQNSLYGILGEDGEDLEEEVFDETPLDPINAYVVFRDALLNMSHANPTRYQIITESFTPEEKLTVERTVQLASEAETKHT